MAEEKLGTKLRYTDSELSLIKNTFSGNKELLVLFRKFLLQGEMSEEEIKLLNSLVSNPEILRVLEKAVNPKLDKMASEFQTVDLFSNFNFEPTPYEHAVQVFKARVYATQYLDAQFGILKNIGIMNEISFDSMTVPVEDDKETYIHVMARNFLLSHIDTQLFNSLYIIAGTKDETPEMQKKRLTKDSSK